MKSDLTWEQAVRWLREQPDQSELVRACYYDDPLLDAARRFADSDEWRAVRTFLPTSRGIALDLGAGRGISSFALARDGWHVTALEPDPSLLVGAGAIRQLARDADLSIAVVENFGEKLPFDDTVFDLVYGRQVLHHARDLLTLCCEIARVLKPGGRLVATREHVISRAGDLPDFLNRHPLHKWYGGENAFLLDDYVAAIRAGGLRLVNLLGSFDNVINYFPMTYAEWSAECLTLAPGKIRGFIVANNQRVWGKWLLARLAMRRSRKDNTPGRLYSFIAERTHR